MVEKFNDGCETTKGLPQIKSEHMMIRSEENYLHKAIPVPREVPYARWEQEIAEIRKLENYRIVETVEVRPTEFCSHTTCPGKSDETLWLIANFTHPNKQVLRTVHPSMSSLDVIHSIKPHSNYFATFECKKGYWQVPLAEENRDLATFIYTLQIFWYRSPPMGFVSTGDS